MSRTPTRVMVISNTHEHCLNGANMPEVDILLHTGDLTNFGELEALKESVKMMGTIEAELKLVIAGNHEISLGAQNRVENMSDEEYSEYHHSAIEIMTGQLAKDAGVVYLKEGTHTFSLKNGAKFTVYASPYTCGSMGFQYQINEDRFNDATQVAPGQISIATNPIPEGVDIVMTHGPPHTILDQVYGSYKGCRNLLRAPDGSVKDPSSATPMETEQVNEYPYTNEWPIQSGKQTLMVNAAIMMNTAKGMRPNYKPFVVSLNLPCDR
ncbi:uncharacterized protein EAE97_005088 [Botrytis byssoidea]|uniref:Calcineurin-like phosphoesterase domain-containing protein n=1 Tax=Botrytis byssoidea TaxID=139641 RepID=A0A9P5IPI3_9HELO|nr:uncharacterized protein EAE97_005088 [Botrytis byssoidea]KAF7946050.1 hypothetical protein EAE97_005088 [Botrytis byssoidea]